MKTQKTFDLAENCTVIIDKETILIRQGRTYNYIALSLFAMSIGVLIVTAAFLAAHFLFIFSLLPILYILNCFVYKNVSINLVTSEINLSYSFSNKKIYSLQSINFTSNKFRIKEQIDEDSIQYSLDIDGISILKFNCSKTAYNVQRTINKNTDLVILYDQSPNYNPFLYEN